jgi:hypothetical protein
MSSQVESTVQSPSVAMHRLISNLWSARAEATQLEVFSACLPLPFGSAISVVWACLACACIFEVSLNFPLEFPV